MTNVSTELDRPDAGELSAPLAIAGIDRKRWDLVKATVAKGASDQEVAMFLELAAKYDLDPFAKEIWCAKGSSSDGDGGRLLIMVGRDGLRKIAQRNNIHIDGDVVHSTDTFLVHRTADGNRTVEHSWSGPADRGEIIGAWAECREGGPEGRPLGFFYAAMSEYKPTNEKKLKYSPWGTQESVMILAAAERQALRQATPLSGLLVEGEGEINDERALGQGQAPEDRGALLDAIVDNIPLEQQERAKELIDEQNSLAPHSWSASKVELVFKGKRKYETSRELAAIEKAIDELRARPPLQVGDAVEDAEVVEQGENAPRGAPYSTSDGSDDPNRASAEARVPADTDIELAERIRAERVEELDRVLAEDGSLTEQQRSDVEAELDALTTAPPSEDVDGQAALEL